MDRPIWENYQGMDLEYMEVMEDYIDYLESALETYDDDMRLIDRSSKPVYLDGKVQDMNLGGDDDEET